MPAFFEAGKPGSLNAALTELCTEAEAAVKGGAGCLVISDREATLNSSRVPIPMLLAVGAVHHHLITSRLRSDTSIVAETAQCFSTHHVAVLVGYGAHGVVPYLALEACRWAVAPCRRLSLAHLHMTLEYSTVAETGHACTRQLFPDATRYFASLGKCTTSPAGSGGSPRALTASSRAGASPR